MTMNTTIRFAKLSAAVALGLSLMGASLAADAASAAPGTKAHQLQSGPAGYGQGKVIHLGTIKVTRADMEGAKPKAKPRYGSSAFLGKVTVTAADSPMARDAAAAARKDGTLYLGSITVTSDDTEAARYAMARADQSGTLYLGSVRVTPRDAKAPVVGGMLAVTHYLAPKTLLTVISTLVIGRAGG
jgi:hypothetical protein